MRLPEALLNSLESVDGFNRDPFVKVHESGEQVTSIRVNPFKSSVVNRESSGKVIFHVSGLTSHEKVPWTDFGYYLSERPSFTFDPLFHAGCYYVQEASSMFLESALRQTVDLSQPLQVLDLCAAPGGKSTHILSLISSDSLLVSNEVIRSRANILNDNLVKWGCNNVVVTNNDPKDFQKLSNYFDVIVVDAPCSGSGLFRRDPEAIEEWSEPNVMLCSQRQQRILADVLPSLKNGGVLLYSTCSYSKEEDEFIVDWLEKELIMNNEKLIIDPGWGIVKSKGAYRFWPDKIKGEGFFISCLRKRNDNEDEAPKPSKIKPEKFSSQEIDVLRNSITTEGLAFLRHGKTIHAVPEKLLGYISAVSSKLRLVNRGTRIGEIIKDKLVPDHSLAMSTILSDRVKTIELNYEQAIQYLKKKDLKLETGLRGWSLVTHLGHPLGWINILSNRINNYYPKELRILKD